MAPTGKTCRMNPGNRSLVRILLLLLVLLASAGCREHRERQEPASGQAEAWDENHLFEARQGELIRMTIISRYNPRAMVEHYQPMLDYLATHTPYRFKLVLSRDYTDAVNKICNGDVAIASLGGMTFHEAEERCGVKPLVRPLSDRGDPYYRSVFVVRDDSPLQSVDELVGRSLALASPHSTSGALVPIHMLWKRGIMLKDLSSYSFTNHHDRVAKSVLSGEYDAGALKDVVARDYMKYGLRIIGVSDPIPGVPIVAGPACPDSLAMLMRSVLVNMDPDDPDLAGTIQDWDPEFRHGFALTSSGDYDVLTRMLHDLESAGYTPGDWR